jgi:hypothetical protein
LKGAIAPNFSGWDLDITDSKRVETWLQEFRQYEANGNLPQLSIIRLPNDHTAGTRPGAPHRWCMSRKTIWPSDV